MAVPFPRRHRSSATWRLRQVAGPGRHGAVVSRNGELTRHVRAASKSFICWWRRFRRWRVGHKGDVEFLTHLRAILNVIPAYTFYSASSGGLTFVNKRTA